MTFLQSHDRFLDIFLATGDAAEPLFLALAVERVDALYLDVEQRFDRFLDLRLGRSLGDLEITWLCSDANVAFSVITGATIVS